MKIIADRQIPFVEPAFSTLGEVVLCEGRKITPEIVADADILLVRSVTPVSAGLLEGSPVRFVASATSGIDHVDLEYLKTAEISFAAAQGSNAQAVVEYVLSSLLVLAGQQGFDLQSKTAGIIGCGQVGSRLRSSLTTLGIECLVNDPPLKHSSGGPGYCDLSAIMTADIISLHAPLTDSGLYPTRSLVNETFLAGMKADAILINTSRGGVVNEGALKAHIRRHPGFSVVMDVWEYEPQIDLELLSLVDIGTPHIAGYSTDAKLRATEMIYAAACDFLGRQHAWQPGSEVLDRARQHIRLDTEMSDAEAVQLAIPSHYDVRSDAAALRRALEIDRQKTGYYFDELRKNYPVRREFPATTLELSSANPARARLFEELGFNVDTHSSWQP